MNNIVDGATNSQWGILQVGCVSSFFLNFGVITFIYCFEGTIRSCQKFLVQHQRRNLVAMLGETKDPKERQQIQDLIRGCGLSQNTQSDKEKDKPKACDNSESSGETGS